MEQTESHVSMRGVVLPVLMGWELALWRDRCPDGFRPVGAWHDSWSDARVQTLGLDLGWVRLRLVLEPTANPIS